MSDWTKLTENNGNCWTVPSGNQPGDRRRLDSLPDCPTEEAWQERRGDGGHPPAGGTRARQSESLAELLDWLIEQKAWQAVDDLRRFYHRFAVEPRLLYMLAQAYAEQGPKQKERAEETAGLGLANFCPASKRRICFATCWWPMPPPTRAIRLARREFEHIVEQATEAETDELRAEGPVSD